MTDVVTGGTGFLGLHLVAELLLTGRHVTLLARGDGTGVRERVRRFLTATGTASRLPAPLDRSLTVLRADVDEPLLGLPPAEHRELAAAAREIWHVAGRVTLHGDDERVWRTNVHGTGHVLGLASLAAPTTPLRHISTAFVAGTRQGVVTEDDAGPPEGFENRYEHSKHEAEGLVRDYAARRGGRALIFRPSVLIPPGPRTVPGLPADTLGRLLQILDRIPSGGPRTLLRISGHPQAHVNLLPVDWAARAMVHIARHDAGTGVSTVHIVHPTDTPVRAIAAALEDVSPVRIRMVPAEPDDPTRIERAVYRRSRGFLPYFTHRRRFDDTVLRGRTAGLPPSPPVDRTFLRACLVNRRAAGEATAAR